MSRSAEVADIKAVLQSRVEILARELLPDGRRAGKYWMAKNPSRDDARPTSFWVALSGVPGSWRDEATGQKGDILGLIQLCLGCDFKGALDWARGWLGLADMPAHVVAQARTKVAELSARDAEHEAYQLAEKRKRAFGSWLHANEKINGSIVDTYLASRGITLAALASPPRALRYATRKHIESGQFLPVMMACMTGPDSQVWAVHQTFLAPDGRGKADVTPQRKMWPSYSGAVIRLARGETGMTPGEAAKHGLLDTLCLCEGIEDGLSIALACPELRVWATGSLGNLAHVTVPECAAEVIVCADNDWGKAQAEKLLRSGIEALGRQGRQVRVWRSPVGKDANDALRGVA